MLSVFYLSLFCGVLSLLFQMLASLAISVFLSASIAAFWMHLEDAEAKHEDPNAEPEPEQLN